MKEIIFVTTNNGKFHSLERRLPADFKLIQQPLELIEPQANSAEEVCIAKAKQAFAIVGKPVVVQDSSFHINAYNGFPGVYVKYMNESMGVEGLLKMMANVEDRSCYFSRAMTYIEDENTWKTFVHTEPPGRIALEADNSDTTKAWSVLWKVFIPHWSDKPLSAIANDEKALYQHDQDEKSEANEFSQFVKWLQIKIAN